MTYATDSTRRSGNNAIELISFRTGPNTYIHTSTHTKDITIGTGINAITYRPFPFNRGRRRISTAFTDDDSVKVIVQPDHPICAHYRNMPTNYDVSVMVRQGYLNDDGTPRSNNFDTDYPILTMGWIGAQEMDAETGEYTLSVVTVGDTLSAPSLTRYYQHSCPLRLYGPSCRAVAKAIEISPIAILNNTITLVPGWHGASREPVDFVGGVLTFTKTSGEIEYRTVSRAEAERLVFVGSTQNLANRIGLSLSVGCPHTLDGCRDLHDNSKRYGGFPWMPLENPTRKSIR